MCSGVGEAASAERHKRPGRRASKLKFDGYGNTEGFFRQNRRGRKDEDGWKRTETGVKALVSEVCGFAGPSLAMRPGLHGEREQAETVKIHPAKWNAAAILL